MLGILDYCWFRKDLHFYQSGDYQIMCKYIYIYNLFKNHRFYFLILGKFLYLSFSCSLESVCPYCHVKCIANIVLQSFHSLYGFFDKQDEKEF
jgi:hypothetical protein